jgi:hypothetical protein
MYNVSPQGFYAQWSLDPPRTQDVLDWGDLGTPGVGFTPSRVYVMVSGGQDPGTPGAWVNVTWNAEDSGPNTPGRIPWVRLKIVNLPNFGDPSGAWWNAWQFVVDFQRSGQLWTLDGNDLDGDGLVDFSYDFWFYNVPPNTSYMGTFFGPYVPIAGEDGGAKDVFELYGDPNLTTYYGVYWFGGPPLFAQFYMQMDKACCSSAGTSPPGVLDYCWSDIYPAGPGCGDCLVNISDLGTLLSNYAQPGTYTYTQGDIYPKYDGDGVVNVGDLGQMLAQYGDNCNGSP